MKKITKRAIIIAFFIALIAGAVIILVNRAWFVRQAFAPTETQVREGSDTPYLSVQEEVTGSDGEERKGEAKEVKSEVKSIEVIAENLDIPWEVVKLPDGDILVTERPGSLKRIGKKGGVIPIQGVVHRGEGGLLGMALHPKYSENQWIYLYFTTKAGDALQNRIERYRLQGNTLQERAVILDGIPGAQYHDGGRIAFGPDQLLYIATGDAGNSGWAQDRNSLAGKILRVRDDGSLPDDNPFGNEVYSYGHRNVQGIAWDDEGRLWATEHGRSGVQSGFDELNLIVKGSNYGWPVIQGDEKKEGMVTPVINSGPRDTWAPSGAAFVPPMASLAKSGNGSIFFSGLRGEALYEAALQQTGSAVDLTMHFRQEYGRIRAVVFAQDGFLYITTSNTDGRGKPKKGDDKIIRVNPGILR